MRSKHLNFFFVLTLLLTIAAQSASAQDATGCMRIRDYMKVRAAAGPVGYSRLASNTNVPSYGGGTTGSGSASGAGSATSADRSVDPTIGNLVSELTGLNAKLPTTGAGTPQGKVMTARIEQLQSALVNAVERGLVTGNELEILILQGNSMIR